MIRHDSPTNQKSYALPRLVLAAVIALLVLYTYSGQDIRAEDFALGKDNFHGFETWNGLVFTASSVKAISSTVELHAVTPPLPDSKSRKLIAWFGNSQLHTINQFTEGDHLAPYWFRELGPCPICLVPLGFSLPNANFQEYFLLSQFVIRKLPIDVLLLEAVFDDLREDGLRGDFSGLLSSDVRGDLGRFPVGNDMLDLFDAQSSKSAGAQENSALDGFVQQSIEETLTKGLGEVWPLWKDREQLRTVLLTELYWLRNRVLNIKPTTVRKVIKPRYDRNMRALEAILSDSRKRGIPVVMYVAPIRQNRPLPYDLIQYGQWKMELAKLAVSYSAVFVNLEKLVPNEMWGTYHEDDVDFMHFQGAGHKLLAEALFPIVQSAMK